MFLNTDVILSIVQSVEIQVKTFEEFKKVYEINEARKQTEIFMRALLSGGKQDK